MALYCCYLLSSCSESSGSTLEASATSSSSGVVSRSQAADMAGWSEGLGIQGAAPSRVRAFSGGASSSGRAFRGEASARGRAFRGEASSRGRACRGKLPLGRAGGRPPVQHTQLLKCTLHTPHSSQNSHTASCIGGFATW